MGPAVKGSAPASSRKPEDPPVLGDDKYQFRRDVATWVNYLKSAAEAKDKVAAARLKTLVTTLASSLPLSFRQMVERDIDQGLIDDSNASFESQEKGILHVVSLVASDSPTESLDRLSTSFKEVFSCCRGVKESVSDFATRFVGLSSRYMMLAKADRKSKDSRMLGLCLLQNAKLEQSTLNAVKIQLLNSASARSSSNNRPGAQVRPARTRAVEMSEAAEKSLLLGLKRVRHMLDAVRKEKSKLANLTKLTSDSTIDAIRDMESTIKRLKPSAVPEVSAVDAGTLRSRLISHDEQEVVFYLEDAQAALAAIETSSPADSNLMTEKSTIALFSSLQKKAKPNERGVADQAKASGDGGGNRNVSGNQSDKRPRCYLCGKHGHVAKACWGSVNADTSTAEGLKLEYERRLRELGKRKRETSELDEKEDDDDDDDDESEAEVDITKHKKRKVSSLFPKGRRV
jgi:hypothetical protein